MSISQDDRISISKKIVSIPREIASANNVKAILDANTISAQKKDEANKNIATNYTNLINQYQNEFANYDGNIRTQVTELDFLNSAKHVVGNFFNPNMPNTPTPGLPSGVWVNMPPYSKNIAIGKNYSETYTVTTKESDLINTINGFITSIQALSNVVRSTGQGCGASGTCSLPSYTTQATCLAASPTPGTWTSGSDIISNDSTMQGLSSSLIAAVANWKTFILNTQSIINAIVDSNSNRNNSNIATSGQITTTNNSIASWQSFPTFDTTHGQTTCIGFNSYNVNLLLKTKYRADGLLVLKNAITQREIDIASRVSDLNTTYLGSITQAADGTIINALGLYGQRFRIIDLRINLMSGTLPAVLAIDAGKGAQDQSIASNNNASLAYEGIIKASLFSAPSVGTANIHVLDASGFSVSDNVYVIADGQNEIPTSILAIAGNMITLNKIIPVKYSDAMFARIYKAL